MEMMALQRDYSLARQKSSAERAALEAQHAQALSEQGARHQAELRQHVEAAVQAAAVHEATSAQLQQVLLLSLLPDTGFSSMLCRGLRQQSTMHLLLIHVLNRGAGMQAQALVAEAVRMTASTKLQLQDALQREADLQARLSASESEAARAQQASRSASFTLNAVAALDVGLKSNCWVSLVHTASPDTSACARV